MGINAGISVQALICNSSDLKRRLIDTWASISQDIDEAVD